MLSNSFHIESRYSRVFPVGLVMYPVSLCEADGTLKSKVYSEFVFKAKGDAHRNIKVKKSVQVDPAVASSIVSNMYCRSMFLN